MATNTISQGDTKQVGLDHLQESGWNIYRAVSSQEWPGDATLEVAIIWSHLGVWANCHLLNDSEVPGITTLLTSLGDVSGAPKVLAENRGYSFEGVVPRGSGFFVETEHAQSIVAKYPEYEMVLRPNLIGRDLNNDPYQRAGRYIIDFNDMTREEASQYPIAFQRTVDLVLPERKKIKHEGTRKKGTEFFWRFDATCKDMREAIAECANVMVMAQTSKTLSPAIIPNCCICDQTVVVFRLNRFQDFAIIASSLHYHWSIEYGATMRTDPRYTPKNVFLVYPFPGRALAIGHIEYPELNRVGRTYHDFRQSIMINRQEGLTKTYNRFHNPGDSSADIQKLRDLHMEMDQAVAAAYGWNDFDLGHGFHDTKQGFRFTISEMARREVLQRLLKLNHERYAEEVKQGLHGKRKKSKKVTGEKKFAKKQEANLFDNVGGDE